MPDWKKESKAKLRGLKEMRHFAKEGPLELAELEGKMTSTGGSSGSVTTHGGGNKTEERWINLMSSAEELKERI